MNNYLLDTTTIIDCLRGRKKVIKFLEDIASENASIGCCLVNIVEVLAETRDEDKEVTRKFLNSLEYYNISRDIAEKAGNFLQEYRKKGVTLYLGDAIIAALAINNNLILVTNNAKHYPMPEIKIKVI